MLHEKDWHKTQNNEYLELLKNRIYGTEKLIWTEQFAEIINENIFDLKNIKINDFGCNVGHFCKVLDKIKIPVTYTGFDISQTYLDIAKKQFSRCNFSNLDISEEIPEVSEVSIMSATLEHIPNHKKTLENILNTTSHLFVLRTFLGEKYLEDSFHKDGAEKPYLIKQFTLDFFYDLISPSNWKLLVVNDKATNSKVTLVNQKIPRMQKVLIFQK